MSGETDWNAIHRMESVADKMSHAADRAEQAAQRIANMLEYGYGGAGLRLIELLENAEAAQLRATPSGDGRE